ncbi:MAG TPA: sensor domain-containing diguanylate cyclase [Firmicutes bacterium]|nr:sensor domain-containing diguanylate cyclase [Bacillota bacterium]
MDIEERIQLRLRVNLYFHTVLTIILTISSVILLGIDFILDHNLYFAFFLFNLLGLLCKIILYKKDFSITQRYFWVFSLVDVGAVSLAYYLTASPLSFVFPFYLICIFITVREIVPGEVSLATALSIIGFSLNLLLLWEKDPSLFSYTKNSYVLCALFFTYSALLFTATLTHLLSKQDHQFIKSMRAVLHEKEDHLKALNKVNASLEEKYAASYTLSLIQQYIHHELYESKLLTKITDIVQGVLGSAFTAIFGLAEDQSLKVLAYSGVKDFTSLLQIIQTPKWLPHKALTEQSLLGWESASSADIQLLQQYGINSILCIPLYTKEVKIGILVVSHFQANVFKNDQRELLQIIGNQLSLALENIKLHQATADMALHDQLTGLYNRTYFNNYLENIKEESIKKQKPLSFSSLIFDIDHFKQVNDVRGHLVGDDVLKIVASILQKNTDENSVAIRYGGEEFLLLSRNTDLNQLKEVAERIRQQIASLEFTDKEGRTFSITISGGIASIPKHAKTTEEVLQKADEALYRAKESGRNRIIVYNNLD